MIRKIDHLGIAVRSITEGRALYEALGLAVAAIEEVPDEGVRVALIPCGESLIELLEPLGPDSPIARFLEKRGPGIHHVCLGSDDLAGDDARLRAGGCWVQFVHPRSTGGVLIELSQPGADEEAAAGGPAAALDEEIP